MPARADKPNSHPENRRISNAYVLAQLDMYPACHRGPSESENLRPRANRNVTTGALNGWLVRPATAGRVEIAVVQAANPVGCTHGAEGRAQSAHAGEVRLDFTRRSAEVATVTASGSQTPRPRSLVGSPGSREGHRLEPSGRPPASLVGSRLALTGRLELTAPTSSRSPRTPGSRGCSPARC